jgi:Flp pilus assembly pilin Flp
MNGFLSAVWSYRSPEKGQSVVEYALILSFVAVVAAVLLMHSSDIGNGIANTVSALVARFD